MLLDVLGNWPVNNCLYLGIHKNPVGCRHGCVHVGEKEKSPHFTQSDMKL